MGNALLLPDCGSAMAGSAFEQSYLDQIQRVLESETFRFSTTLRQLFSFLAARGLQGDVEQVKEYTIGVEALNRRDDFDPKSDPIVRVQMHRLRQKLREYYDAEGQEDAVRIELPKGHYVLKFVTQEKHSEDADGTAYPQKEPCSVDDAAAGLHGASAGPDSAAGSVPEMTFSGEGDSSGAGDAAVASVHAHRGFWHRPVWSRWVFVCVVGAVCFALGAAVHLRGGAPGKGGAWAMQQNSMTRFWSALLKNDASPIICYPDKVFLLDKHHDLFWFPSGADGERGELVNPQLAEQNASSPALVQRAGPLYYENGYTGIGELTAVGQLAALLTRLGKKVTILSSREITASDLQQHTVIFLGSPSQNAAVGQLPRGDLQFDFAGKDPGNWNGRIVNLHPTSGQKASYQTIRNPATGVLKTDFGFFSVEPGVAPGRFVVIIAGLDTTGTEGSSKFATSVSGIDDLSQALVAKGLGGEKKFTTGFQALLRVHLENGYQVLDSSLVAVDPFQKHYEQ